MYDDLPITIGRYYEDRDLLAFIDSLPEEKCKENTDSFTNLEEAAEELLQAALRGGGKDNISLVLIQDDTECVSCAEKTEETDEEEKAEYSAEGETPEEVTPQ